MAGRAISPVTITASKSKSFFEFNYYNNVNQHQHLDHSNNSILRKWVGSHGNNQAIEID